ncbi:alpha/beta fold hydrolase [Flavobacterium piscinae]|uniref:Alpha/beta fold hydrolase n=1 Tax=Flavobacterium piscinae TaxID=2506424 RepID=A0A4Q1KS78_9FLAO|nr:alpha/beta fold hydrolase [Flavobacterium piscinae]RXR32993.1 alpha/beta fold hydrolase [Flavobacterium piscinae]
MKKVVLLTLLLCPFIFYAQDITGKWYGKLSVMGSELLFGLDFSKNDTSYSGKMDIPQQNAKGIPLSSVTFEDKTLVFKFDQAKFSYTGKLNASNEFEGVFSQNGQNFPLNLTRTETTLKKINRPQEPKPPFDYNIEEVSFINEKDNITLSGTFTTPKSENFPLAILISGSGQQDRNSEIFGHKPFWVIADYLTKNGIGVLRIDDRGIGKSGGNPSTSTTYDFATDIEAAVQYIKTKKGVNPKKIGLIGHSEGGMIAPIVASKDKNISFIVLLAAPGIPCDELLMEQTFLMAKVSGASDAEISKSQKTNRMIYDLVKSDKSNDEIKSELANVFYSQFKNDPSFANLSETDKNQMINQQIQSVTYPWIRSFLRFKPEEYLKKIKCPVLVLNGEKDLQVPPQSNLEGIKTAFKNGGNKKTTIKQYPNLNHLFQECTTGSTEEYGEIEQTFSPQVLSDIKDWILLHAK